jgi:tetraacyldisaccharide 4'-kinase
VTPALSAIAEATWARRGAWARAASAALVPASWPYAGIVALRNRLYDGGWLAIERVPARVVSIGNLTVGGSGKTPLTLWLAERLAAGGRRVAVVARGYHKRVPGVVVVGREGAPLVSARDGGDEAALLARRFAGPVVVGEDRVAAARTAIEECGAEIVLLDDGFQHRRLGREVDVVILGSDPRRERPLPAGRLREGPAALRRANVVVLMDAETEKWAAGIVPATVPVVRAATHAVALVEPGADGWVPGGLDRLAGREVAALAGIARPGRFVAALERLGARVGAARLLGDHHAFDAADLAWIDQAARRALVVTTEKDLVKLVEMREGLPVAALRVGVEVTPADTLVRWATGEDVVCESTWPERR